jgi:hypothetical protein
MGFSFPGEPLLVAHETSVDATIVASTILIPDVASIYIHIINTIFSYRRPYLRLDQISDLHPAHLPSTKDQDKDFSTQSALG